MIQGLGTIKLLTDIDQDKVLQDFEFTQFGSLEEADDRGEFYVRMQRDRFENVKEMFSKYFNYLINAVSFINKNYIFKFFRECSLAFKI